MSKFPRVAARTRPKPAKSLVKLPPLRYAIYDANGELSRIQEIDDPRARICSEFNRWMQLPGMGHGSYALPIDSEVVATPRRRKAVCNG